MQAAYVSQGTGANQDYGSLLVHKEEIAKTPKLPQGKKQNQKKNFIILFNLMIMRFFLS